MNLTVISRQAFTEGNGDYGETLNLSDGSNTNVWNKKTFEKQDGSLIILEKGQKINVEDIDSGDIITATIMGIRQNSIDVALTETKWEMRFPTSQFVEPI